MAPCTRCTRCEALTGPRLCIRTHAAGGHSFHAACIDEWLLRKGRPPAADDQSLRGLASCPLCKAVPIVVPEPSLGPLARVAAPSLVQVEVQPGVELVQLESRSPATTTAVGGQRSSGWV